jgi:hypothetical protein
VWKDKIHSVDASSAYPILETIFAWLNASVHVTYTPSLDALKMTIEDPDSVVSTSKFAKYID